MCVDFEIDQGSSLDFGAIDVILEQFLLDVCWSGSYQAVFIKHLKKKPVVLWADLQTWQKYKLKVVCSTVEKLSIIKKKIEWLMNKNTHAHTHFTVTCKLPNYPKQALAMCDIL